jgi:hypothetical protein
MYTLEDKDQNYSERKDESIYPRCGLREEIREPKEIRQLLPGFHRANIGCVGSPGKTRSSSDIFFGVGTAQENSKS